MTSTTSTPTRPRLRTSLIRRSAIPAAARSSTRLRCSTRGLLLRRASTSTARSHGTSFHHEVEHAVLVELGGGRVVDDPALAQRPAPGRPGRAPRAPRWTPAARRRRSRPARGSARRARRGHRRRRRGSARRAAAAGSRAAASGRATTFCWLPPESVPTRRRASGGRTSRRATCCCASASSRRRSRKPTRA